ncbi:tachykinin-like peptides receptor 86C isoform X2 [Leptopilina boulardi]|uniref:tachykinin-like peptides receptor 86C isoform X2 n=1 Tax=Leptopilina boulardi TaxID=63433 RepID=UPI0021F61E8C|nr:tachykinin-like peptides receptor 86C isoform X2 [Leptopilina boulardi]
MNSVSLVNLHNCTALVLDQNITLLMGLNRSELLQVLKEALDRSLQREVLRDALSDCLQTNQQRPFDLPWWQKLVWSLVYAIILMVATGGNIIVMWIVLAHRRMRTVTNYFLVNLSVADLMMSVLNCVFNFIFMLNSDWPFGSVYCTISNFVANVTVASSVFTLVVTSFDRYMAIMRPLKHHMSRKRTILALFSIWFASAMLAIPCLLYSTTNSRRYNNGNTRIVCYMQWPDGSYPNSKTEYMFRLYFQQIICRCCCVIGRSNLRTRQMHELAGFQRSGILPSHSGHMRSVSIRWRHSNAETHVQALKTNSRSICEKIHSRDDVAII